MLSRKMVFQNVHKIGATVFHGSLALNLMLLVTLYLVGLKKTDLVVNVSGKN